MIEIIELLNGEKLIADIENSNNNQLFIRDPFVIAPQQQGQNGQVNFAFVPWPVFRDVNESEFKINTNMIVTRYTPNSQITDHYNRAMAQKSGLIIPPSVVAPSASKFIRD